MSGVRRHGLQLPLSTHQIGSIFGVAYTITSFVLVLRPTQLQYAIFFSTFALGLIAFLVTVLVDPRVDTEQAPRDANRFCNSCELSMDSRTKHCRICNKCIQKFDHHCLYLNTCIGGKNYRPFFVLVSLTAIWLAMYLTIAVMRIITGVNTPNSNDNLYGSALVYLCVLGCLSLVPLFMFIAIFSLWLFHIYIGFLRISTYDWIIGKRASDVPIEMPAQQSERRQEEIQARRQEIYEQWVRQNRLRQQQQQQQQQLQGQPVPALSSSSNLHSDGKPDKKQDASGADVKVSMDGEPVTEVPRSNSESILTQVEEVLGIDISVNEGQLVSTMSKPLQVSSQTDPPFSNIAQEQDPVR